MIVSSQGVLRNSECLHGKRIGLQLRSDGTTYIIATVDLSKDAYFWLHSWRGRNVEVGLRRTMKLLQYLTKFQKEHTS